MKIRSQLLRIYFALLFIATFLLLRWLLIIGAGSGAVLGYSLRWLVLIIPVFLLMVGFGWLLYRTWYDPVWRKHFGIWLAGLLERDTVYINQLLIGSSIIFIGTWVYQIGLLIRDPYFQGYFTKYVSFLLWGIAVAASTLLLARFYRFGSDLQIFASQQRVVKATGIAFSVLLGLAIFMALTRLGLEPDLVGWGDPGTPVLPSQVRLLVGFGIAGLAIREILWERWAGRISRRTRQIIDIIIFGALWLLTTWAWQIQPLQPTYFVPDPVAPNFEFYPSSDAANYEVSAQELLIGMGYSDDVRRPLYSLFLALAQQVSGIGYAHILFWQIPLLALIPPLLYLLGKGLHSRLAGILIAGFAIFHEINAIHLSGIVNVSHAKLIMSDLPTALGVVAFIVVLVYWWQAPAQRKAYPLFAGGILALTMLVRIQVLILLPSVLLPIWIAFWSRKRQLISTTLLLIVGLVLVLIPWLWRGKQASGSVSFAEAAQESQIGLIGNRYSFTPDQWNFKPLPDESSNQYSQRMLVSAFNFVLEQPLIAIEFITTHLFRNLISTFLTLPPVYNNAESVRHLKDVNWIWKRCCSVNTYVKNSPYWKNWDGFYPQGALIPLALNLFLFSLGIGAAWKRHRFLGVLPIWINLCYALGNALVRSSGWRFNLPVDWVGLFYYNFGLLQIIIWGAMFFVNRQLPRATITQVEFQDDVTVPFPWKQAFALSAVLFLMSAAIPITEAAIPPRYPPGWLPDQLADPELQEQLQSLGISDPLSEFAQHNQLRLLHGRALYPRYYPSGEGIPGTSWLAYIPRDYARLGFYLLGPASRNIVFAQDEIPSDFPHATDVIVLGCHQDDYLQAQLVLLVGETQTILLRDPKPDWSCQLSQ